MKKLVVIGFLALFVISFVSAEIIFPQQPHKIYNFGEAINVPFTVKTLSDVSGTVNMDLICNGQRVNFYKNGVALYSGQEKKLEASLVLTRDNIGALKGSCVVKAFLGEAYSLTNDFSISDSIIVTSETKTPEVSPREYIVFEGSAVKESGDNVNGFVQIDIYFGNATVNSSSYLTQLETVNNGFFLSNITSSEDMPAGTYKVVLSVYEKDNTGLTTNQGVTQSSFAVKQVPQNIEIILENSEVEPGTSLRAKAVLHDQTGKNIDSPITIMIKDVDDKLVEQLSMRTDEFFEFPVESAHAPGSLMVLASTETLESSVNFSIAEKKDINIEVVNKSLIVTNVGNVPYCNKSILLKIGESPLNIRPCLEVGEEKNYVLTAPDGEYNIEVISENRDPVKSTLTLTGGAIGIKEASQGVVSLVRYPFIWIFVIGIMGFVAFMIFKNGYRRSFIGTIHRPRAAIQKIPNNVEGKESFVSLRNKSMIKSRNKAELSLSIKGEKQNASVIALRIKNLDKLEAKKGNAEETFQKIVNIAEEKKALTYENQNDLFFIFAPAKTRTFRNEQIALETAGKIQALLLHHNRMFKDKIEYGISLNYGTIVGKQEETFKFMSMGTLVTSSKKLANHSHERVFLAEKFREKLTNIKSEKHTEEGMTYYTITEIRGGNAEHQKFISSFIKRLEKK